MYVKLLHIYIVKKSCIVILKYKLLITEAIKYIIN